MKYITLDKTNLPDGFMLKNLKYTKDGRDVYSGFCGWKFGFIKNSLILKNYCIPIKDLPKPERSNMKERFTDNPDGSFSDNAFKNKVMHSGLAVINVKEEQVKNRMIVEILNIGDVIQEGDFLFGVNTSKRIQANEVGEKVTGTDYPIFHPLFQDTGIENMGVILQGLDGVLQSHPHCDAIHLIPSMSGSLAGGIPMKVIRTSSEPKLIEPSEVLELAKKGAKVFGFNEITKNWMEGILKGFEIDKMFNFKFNVEIGTDHYLLPEKCTLDDMSKS